jgi:hypothetical protein
VPQFVAVTFDDNFSPEGMDWATGFLRPLKNPAGSGNPATFDGAAVRTTFPSNSLYLSGMQASWETAVSDGHEFANHTVNHGDGIAYGTDQWSPEIVECTSALVGGLSAPGGLRITGFRAPYLHYDDALFTVLVQNGFAYDTSIMGCWADSQTGGNCTWPYTMDSGSPDADVIDSKWAGRNVVPVGPHPIWEMPVAVVFVPDDSLAAQYGFTAGLRQRTANALAGEGNPNFFEQSTGKMVGMDISMLLDGKMTRAEALATLKYTLDLHLAGNRAPMIFVAHTHVYASAWDANAPGVQNTADRRSIIQDFVTYALSKPVVRMRPVADVLAWMKNPVPLGSACTPTTCAAQQATCGSISDGCGGTIDCGSCASGQTCSSSHVCQTASVCQATVSGYSLGRCNATAVYGNALYRCISQAAGVNGEPAGCGTPGVYCSSIAPDNASWGAAAWQLVQRCDTSCTPTTCAAQGKTCGSIADGCGGALSCGTCPSGQTCSASNTCQSTSTSCTGTVSAFSAARCNSTVVYGGALYQCVSQAASVNGEPSGCGTPGVYCSSVPPDNAAWGSVAWHLVQTCP